MRTWVKCPESEYAFLLCLSLAYTEEQKAALWA